MPQRCSVPGCSSTYHNTANISFHTFPRNEKVRRCWRRICADKIHNMAVLDNLRVCSLHFASEAYRDEAGLKKKRLKWNAVPSLHLSSSPDPSGKEISISNRTPLGVPEQDDNAEDERYHKCSWQRGPEKHISLNPVPSKTATPEASTPRITHFPLKKEAEPVEEQCISIASTEPTSPEDSALQVTPISSKSALTEGSPPQVTFSSKNGICQGTKLSSNPTPSKTANPKVTSQVTHFTSKKGVGPVKEQAFKPVPTTTAANKGTHQGTKQSANSAPSESASPEVGKPHTRYFIMKDGAYLPTEFFPRTVSLQAIHFASKTTSPEVRTSYSGDLASKNGNLKDTECFPSTANPLVTHFASRTTSPEVSAPHIRYCASKNETCQGTEYFLSTGNPQVTHITSTISCPEVSTPSIRQFASKNVTHQSTKQSLNPATPKTTNLEVAASSMRHVTSKNATSQDSDCCLSTVNPQVTHTISKTVSAEGSVPQIKYSALKNEAHQGTECFPSTVSPHNSSGPVSEVSSHLRNLLEGKGSHRLEAANRTDLLDDASSGVGVGGVRNPKQLPLVGESCSCGCFNKLGKEAVRKLSENFWRVTDYEQYKYIVECMTVKEVVGLSEDGQTCKMSIVYYLVCVDNVTYFVCSEAFANIHGITEAQLQEITGHAEKVEVMQDTNKGKPSQVMQNTKNVKSSQEGDKGKKEPKKVRLEQEVRPKGYTHIVEHLNSLAVVSSQHSRAKNPNRRYLLPGMHINSLYLMYCSWLQENYHDSEPVPQEAYVSVFKSDFDIVMMPPKDEACEECEELSTKLWLSSRKKCSWLLLKMLNCKEKHIKLMEKFYNDMLWNSKISSDQTEIAICMDLQQPLPTPRIFYEIQYYKKKLWTYNFGIHNLKTGEACMYIWDEAKAGRGSDEIASCLLHYIKTQVFSSMIKLTIFSDSCSAHNKNINLILTCLRLVHEGRFSGIKHVFLTPGHANLPCEKDFSVIEKSLQQQPLYTPDQYAQFVSKCKTKNNFSVIKMDQPDFLDVGVMQGTITKEKEVSEAIKEGKVFEYSHTYREGFAIKAEYNTTDTHKVHLHKDTHNPADQQTFDLSVISLPRKYTKPVQLSEEKIEDIITLMKFVPQEHLGFFEELLMGQSDTAAIVEKTAPDDDMLDYLPWSTPSQHLQANTRTAYTPVSSTPKGHNTHQAHSGEYAESSLLSYPSIPLAITDTITFQGEGKKQPATPTLPVWGGNEGVSLEEVQVKEEVIEEPLEDEGTHHTLTLHPTTTTTTNTNDSNRSDSANQPWRTEEPSDTNPAARDTGSLMSVDGSHNSSNDEMPAGGSMRNAGMEEEEDGGDEDDDDDGDDLWQKVTISDVPLPPPPFTAMPGPRNIPHLQKPVDFVRLFITHAFIDTVARETNRCADRWIEKHRQSQDPHHQHTIHNWVKSGKTTAKEIYAFLAVTMNMSLVIKPSVASYWDNTNRSQATPWFGEHFVLERYVLIMKFLSFADCDTIPDRLDPSYKLYDIQPLITHFCHVFRYYFKPHHHVMVGESMADCGNIKPCSWHCSPLKPLDECAVKILYPQDEYTVKLWYLCDVETGYAVTFEVEKGSLTEKPNKEDEVYDLVMRLLEAGDVLYQGYNLYVGTCSVFPQLLFDLWKCQTLGTGMVLPHQRGLPLNLVKRKSNSWQVCKQKKGPLFCVSFKNLNGKRELLLSTVASPDFYCTQRMSKGKARPLPCIIDDHRKATNSARLQTLTLQTYIPEWSSLKWNTRVAMSVISTAFLNAYLLYTATTTDTPRLSQYSFMASVIEGLTEGYVPI